MQINTIVMNTVNEELRLYIEQEIIPRYDHFDAAHQRDHVEAVIERSMKLAQYYPVDHNMVYAIAAYHDTGLTEGRDTHHLVSGIIIRNDQHLHQWFNEEQISTIAQAAEDHRASAKNEPRSIYGKIVAEADRLINPYTVCLRTVQYSLSHYPDYNKEQHYQRFKQHLDEKYSDHGYLKLWIPESDNAAQLEKLRAIIRDEQQTKIIFEKIWSEI